MEKIFLSVGILTLMGFCLYFLFFKKKSLKKEKRPKFPLPALPFQYDEKALNGLFYKIKTINPTSITNKKSLSTALDSKLGSIGGLVERTIQENVSLSDIFKVEEILSYLAEKEQIVIYKDRDNYIQDKLHNFEIFLSEAKKYPHLSIDNKSIEKQKLSFDTTDAISFFIEKMESIGEIKECFLYGCDLVSEGFDSTGDVFLYYFNENQNENNFKLKIHLLGNTITEHGKKTFARKEKIENLSVLGKMTKFPDSKEIVISAFLTY